MNLQEVIAKHISYDSDGGEKCPHCEKWIKQPHYWIDHKWTLANHIAKTKNYPDIFVEKIEEFLDEIDVTGNAKKDAEIIVNKLETLL